MMGRSYNNIVIVGGGIAGLTLAYKLSLSGHKILLVEKESRVGGLARSFNYNDYTFDVGPHRFHTEVPEVLDFIHAVLDGNCIEIERKSGAWLFKKYFDWPLNKSTPLKMPLPVLLSVCRDFLKIGKKGPEKSFEDYILRNYGETLYEMFFRPYTEKFLKLNCTNISKDWAVTGIERAVIDKKIEVNNLFNLAKSLIFPPPPLKFIYPESGGIGVFSDLLREKIIDNGGTVLVNSKIREIIKDGSEIKKIILGEEIHDCDLLVWTGSVNEILRLLGRDIVELEYLSLLLFNYQVSHEALLDYQWCYYGTQDIPFNRISIPSHFNQRLAPSGKSGVCVELTCRKGAPEWNDPMTLEPAIRKSLIKIGAVKDESFIDGVNIEKINNAYPVYASDYSEKVKGVCKTVGDFANVKLLGRTGTFWYNNMDHSIQAAMRLAKEICSNR